MKTNERRESSVVSTTRHNVKGIKRQRNGELPAAKGRNPISTVLFDSLESYERVLSCASEDKLSFCTKLELQSVLKVNGFQYHHLRKVLTLLICRNQIFFFFSSYCCQKYTEKAGLRFHQHPSHLRKDYMENKFSSLSRVLFQTRYSSLLVLETPVITAVAMEDSEVVQDLATLQWLDGGKKDLVLLSPEEGTSSGGWRPKCVSKVTLAGFADNLVESSTATFKISHSVHEQSTCMVEMSADDCYRPDMSMVVMLESIQADQSPLMYSPDQQSTSSSQEEIINDLASQPGGGLLTEPSIPFFNSLEWPFLLLPTIPSHSNNDAANQQEEHVTQSIHTFVANIAFSEARAKAESEEKDVARKLQPLICQSLNENCSSTGSVPFTIGGVPTIPDQNHWTSALGTKIYMIFEREAELLERPSHGEICEGGEEISCSSISSTSLLEEAAQPSPFVLGSQHSAFASQHIHQAVVKSASNENIDLVEKFAMEALELNKLHNLFIGDDTSGIRVLDETASQGNEQTVADVHDFVELEQDQSSNTSQVREAHINYTACVVPGPQHEDQSSDSPAHEIPKPQLVLAEGNFVGFLGLLAHVSAPTFK